MITLLALLLLDLLPESQLFHLLLVGVGLKQNARELTNLATRKVQGSNLLNV